MVRKRNEIYDAKPRSCFVHAKFMTIVEVCIALALIAGLFTWLSSAATVV